MAETPFVSLYRRFRPGRFDELRGQDHVVRALRSAVRDDRVSHAYLFSGPRGTGKTSSARILAKALNCEAPVDGEPCGSCTSCLEITQGSSLNVHELDAASNNGVDAMRDLVAHAGLGTPGRWKVYIVDEVHMLSTAAANALLKTLEEPPSHVVFVLATTDPQKVPPTIRSRTQHLEFRLLAAETLHSLLESVNEEAGLDVDEEALEAAVRRGRGSARDALSALDQVVASGSADAARPELAAVLEALADGDVSGVLVALSALLAGGWGPQQLATELIDDLRQVFLAALAPELCAVSGPSLERFRALAEAMGLARVVRSMEILGHSLVDMREAPDAQVVLEIAVVRAVRPDLDSGMEALSERVSVLERTQSGAAAFPRPGAPAGRGSGASSAESGPTPVVAPSSEPPTPPRRRRWRDDPPSARCGAARRRPLRCRRPTPPKHRRRHPPSPSPPSPSPPSPSPPSPSPPSPRPSPPPGRPHPRRVAPTSIATASPRPGATASCNPCRRGPRPATPAAASWRWTSRAPTSRCPTPRTGTSAPNSRPSWKRPWATTSERRSRWSSTSTTRWPRRQLAPGPSPAAAGRPPGATRPDPAPPADEVEDVDPRELMEDTSTDQASAAEARLLQAFPGASEEAG